MRSGICVRKVREMIQQFTYLKMCSKSSFTILQVQVDLYFHCETRFLFSDNFTLTLGKETQPIDCSRRHEIMSNVVEAASPYLYPCVIQYSLVATGMFYVIDSLDKRIY